MDFLKTSAMLEALKLELQKYGRLKIYNSSDWLCFIFIIELGMQH
jgi:hypothetical protein